MISAPSPSEVGPTKRLVFQPAFVILSSLVLFTLFWYFGRRAFFIRHLDDLFPQTSFSPLYPFFYFCCASVFFRTIVPLLCIKLVLKRRASHFGYSLRGTGQKAWLSFREW